MLSTKYTTLQQHSAVYQRVFSLYQSRISEMDKCLQQTRHSVQNRLACRNHFAGSRFLRAPAPQRVHHAKRICYAGMGVGFTDGLILPRSSEPKLEVPINSYGLSTRQMAALGLTEDSIAKPLEANEVQNCCTMTSSLCCCTCLVTLPWCAGVYYCEGLL